MLLNATWLFAMAAIGIPVAIHLWNIRPGKTLKVGSVMLIEAASRKSSRSFKVSELLLLALRCLLLMLLALFLTTPIWQGELSNKVKGWILIPKENFRESYQKFKPAIDSLTRQGYEFHYFDRGFAKAIISEVVVQPQAQTAATEGNAPVVNYWGLAQQLDSQVPNKLPIVLYTPDGIVHFAGEKPSLALNLRWQVYSPADSTANWLAWAWFTSNHTIRVVKGLSTPWGTSYTYTDLKTGDERNSPFHVSVNNGQVKVNLNNNANQSVIVDTTTNRIAIYADKALADIGYIKAALSSISEFTGRKTVLKVYSNPALIPPQQSWLYWLSEKPLTEQIIKKSAHILAYQPGKAIAVNSWINTGQQYAVTPTSNRITLLKTINAPANRNGLIWQDGFGNPVLELDEKDGTSIYHFFSRFNPAWNDLVWSNDFPKLLLQLYVNGAPVSMLNPHDRRAIDHKLLLPFTINASHPLFQPLTNSIDLSHYCWLALVLVFLIERWLAHQHKLTPTNG